MHSFLSKMEEVETESRRALEQAQADYAAADLTEKGAARRRLANAIADFSRLVMGPTLPSGRAR